MSPLPRDAFRLAHAVHARLAAASRRARRTIGVAASPRIEPYRGDGTASSVVVRARVLEDRGVVEPRDARGLVDSATAAVRRFATAELPGERVRVEWGGQSWEGATDAEGFVAVTVAPPSDVVPGFHEVHLSLPDHPGVTARATVLVVGDRARFGVVTDIDDTIIATGVRNLAKRAWALFMPEATPRRPFTGAAAMYRALEAGVTGGERNPIFYVSSSPWNLYGHLEHLLARHGLPDGPILLRDWGLTEDGFAPDGRHDHKLDKVLGIVDAHADLPFVLVGDSGQHDAEHYATIVGRRPGRVTCIYIRNVSAGRRRSERLAQLAQEVRDLGSDLVCFDDSGSMVADAARRGLIDPQVS